MGGKFGFFGINQWKEKTRVSGGKKDSKRIYMF
jgi:hypothetical protein